eukprot:UN01491
MWILGSKSVVYSRKTMIGYSMISLLMAIICAYGAAGYVGVKFTVDLVLPCVLLLGLGLDDCFVLTWDYHQQYVWLLHLNKLNRFQRKL